MPNTSSVDTQSILDLIEAISQLNTILNDQLALVQTENNSAGEFIASGVRHIMNNPPDNKSEMAIALMPVIERLQTKDIMSQQILQVQTALVKLNALLDECRLCLRKGDAMPDVSSVIQSVFDGYVMQQQRDAHMRAIGKENTESELTEPWVELF